MGPGPRFEPESRDPQSRRMTAYPTPALINCLNPGRPASTGPKPVPFGLSGTPAYKNKGYIETIKNLNKFLNAPAGIRTRVFGSKGRNDWPDYTTGAYKYK